MNKQEFFRQVLQGKGNSPRDEATAFAPSNIALAKYWGKRDVELNLPCNSSISISLGGLGTSTTLQKSSRDRVVLNGEEIPLDKPFAAKVINFLDYFRANLGNTAIEVITENNIPTAAGLASSASGFAALTLAANDFWNLDLESNTLSAIARIGSGSAARSFWQGFVKWKRGEKNDGTDSYAELLDISENSPSRKLRLALVKIDDKAKKNPSRDAMIHTARTSPYFSAWIETAELELTKIEAAITNGNLRKLLQLAEENALAMHAAMLAARPSLLYLQSETITAMRKVWDLRESAAEIFFTIDAGPNLKLLFEENSDTREIIEKNFHSAIFVNPFE
ncbi:MAG: diphosphomevalonate decarboxylase [Cardiobacteriaceae bacterium]|nr:diphosphomevalonate decarboxylase [Cardiobacteriaceae bacterium]